MLGNFFPCLQREERTARGRRVFFKPIAHSWPLLALVCPRLSCRSLIDIRLVVVLFQPDPVWLALLSQVVLRRGRVNGLGVGGLGGMVMYTLQRFLCDTF